MKDDKFFGDRSEIAKFFGVTRMTLYRWEKVLCLGRYPGCHVHKRKSEVRTWFLQMREKERELLRANPRST